MTFWIWFVIRVYCDGMYYCCFCIFLFCLSLCVFLCVGSLLLRAAQSSVFNLWFPVALRGWCSHNCAGHTGSHQHNPFTHTQTHGQKSQWCAAWAFPLCSLLIRERRGKVWWELKRSYSGQQNFNNCLVVVGVVVYLAGQLSNWMT